MMMYLCPAGAQELGDVRVVISLLLKLCRKDVHPQFPQPLREAEGSGLGLS